MFAFVLRLYFFFGALLADVGAGTVDGERARATEPQAAQDQCGLGRY